MKVLEVSYTGIPSVPGSAEYSFMEVDTTHHPSMRGSGRRDHGKVYCLKNDTHYALIFDQNIPPGATEEGEEQHLLDTGKCPLENRGKFLDGITRKAALEQAQKLATEKGFVLQLSRDRS